MNSKGKLLLFSAAVVVGVAGTVTYYLYVNRRKRSLLLRKKKEIVLISSQEEYLQHHDRLVDELATIKILGLDCEWNTRETRRPISMLQLSSQTGLCLLLRLHLFSSIPDQLRDLMADRRVVKCGVGISCDAKFLRSDYQIFLEGCVDLRHVFMRTRRLRYESSLSLSGLAGTVLGLQMDKRPRIRCSDWEAETLSTEQMEYAALDALAAADILTRLVVSKMSASQTTAQHFNKKLSSLVQGIVDMDFKEKLVRKSRKPASPGVRVKDRKSNAYKSRKGPLYENAQLHAPDGQLLCTCSISKARWYVQKGIGEFISEDPLTVRLLFEPSGRPEPQSSNNYYTLDKSNVCVVCGKPDSHIRKHIVPKEYRRYFPTIMKEHKSHDVLLLCISCHQRSGLHDSVLRLELARTCDAPLAAGDARFTLDRDLDNVRSCARALVNSRSRIPPERVAVLEATVRDYFDVDEVSDELLHAAADVDTKLENKSYVAHGLKVVRHVMENGGLIQFERTWRQHFLDNMKPKFLPEMWDVDHNHERSYAIDQELRHNAQLREELLANGDAS